MYNAESVERVIAFGAGDDEIMPSGALSGSNNNGGQQKTDKYRATGQKILAVTCPSDYS